MLTWTCHICGKERPDNKISVLSKVVKKNGIQYIENIRFCADKAQCKIGASKFSFFIEPLIKEEPEIPTTRFELMDI